MVTDHKSAPRRTLKHETLNGYQRTLPKCTLKKKKQYFEYLYAEEISCELRSNLHSDPSMLSTKLKVIVVTYGLKIQNETKKPTNEVQK